MDHSIEMKNENRWYRLDNAAKIYPAVRTADHAAVFRVAVQLNEIVEPDVLSEALIQTLPRFPTFNVRMQKGLFWYYFEHNPYRAVVTPDKAPVCRPIKLSETNGYLFRVCYFKKRISLEVFHAIADGTGAITLLKAILFKYLVLSGKPVVADEGILDGQMYPSAGEVEDSFQKYYDENSKSSRKEQRAYQIKGTRILSDNVRITHGMIPVASFRHLVKESGATVTEYIVALLIASVYETQLKGSGDRLPVKVFVPVNLRRFLPSETLRNFASYINAGFVFSNGEYSFEMILDFVRRDIRNNLVKEKLVGKIGANVSAERSTFMRLTPLFMKNIAMKTAYSYYGERQITSTVSNIGIISLPESMDSYVDRFEFVLGAPITNMLCCAVCTYHDSLVISFTRVMEETDIERYFFRFLAKKGLDVIIESNDGVSS